MSYRSLDDSGWHTRQPIKAKPPWKLMILTSPRSGKLNQREPGFLMAWSVKWSLVQKQKHDHDFILKSRSPGSSFPRKSLHSEPSQLPSSAQTGPAWQKQLLALLLPDCMGHMRKHQAWVEHWPKWQQNKAGAVMQGEPCGYWAQFKVDPYEGNTTLGAHQ